MKATRALFIPCILALLLVQNSEASNPRALSVRQTPPADTTTTQPLPVSPPVSSSSQSSPSSTSTPASAIQTSTTTSNIVTPPTSTTSSTPASIPSNTNTALTSAPQTPIPVISTDSAGVEVTITETQTPTTTSSAAATTSATKKNESSGLGTGPIVGLSVAGGLALIGIIGFFVWKFTRKRFTDFDDNEAIKWPELNAHGGGTDSHPLPVHNTGRSGFDTGSEFDLSRPPSNTGTNANYSTADLSSTDPYAVPPLPHLNPNQPYHDDPAADDAGYYDPYRGPVPNTFGDPAVSPEWGPGGEAIPMTQMTAGAAAAGAGRRSPGPGMAYDATGRASPGMGRRSPGPQGAYGEYDTGAGRRSPGPQAAYGEGRTSPGPQVAYGGRTSPGAQAAYGGGAGRTSPGPQVAYDAGLGRRSPGPQAAYDSYGTR